MPVQIGAVAETPGKTVSVEQTLQLVDATGNPTITGQVLSAFAAALSMGALFEDQDARKHVVSTRGFALEEGDDFVACAADAEGAIEVEIEEMAGPVAAALLDEADARACYAYYVMNALPSKTLAERTIREIAASFLDESDVASLDEFAKGAFRKMRRKGGAGKVNSMLGAMIAKGAIKRAHAARPGTARKNRTGFKNQGGEKGAGYKGGDYEKHEPGYGQGTAPYAKKWKKFRAKATSESIPSWVPTKVPGVMSAVAKTGKAKNEALAALPTASVPRLRAIGEARHSVYESVNGPALAAQAVRVMATKESLASR